MICCDHNQCFFRMFLIEFISYFDSIIHVFHFVEHSSGVIGVACPVNFTSFYHQEKAFIITFSKEVNSTFRNLCQCQIILFAINGIRQTRRIGSFFLNQDHLFCFCSFCLIVIVTTCYCISCFFKNRENARSFFLVISGGRFQETTACIKIEIGFRQIKSDFIIHITIRLMCIECGRSSMIYTDRSRYAHLFSSFLCLFSNSLNGTFIFSYGNSTIIGFLSCCQCSTCSCRVCY